MRGKDNKIPLTITQTRITPAYAGKRSATGGHIKMKRDHPRLCGEKFASRFTGQSVAGITPAYAGKRK